MTKKPSLLHTVFDAEIHGGRSIKRKYVQQWMRDGSGILFEMYAIHNKTRDDDIMRKNVWKYL
jgi:hypothetical protein